MKMIGFLFALMALAIGLVPQFTNCLGRKSGLVPTLG